jgi:DNA topoisomerase III
MGRIVVVAEKPSVGRDIARVLKCREKGEGCQLGEKYVVTWAIGHLVALCDPDEMDEKYKKWRMDDLPILPESIPLKVLPKTKGQFHILKKWMCDKETDRIICATDAGREGELIFRFIYQEAGCKKPVDRLWISSMTDEAIQEGFAKIMPGAAYDNLYVSASCRAQADWLVGMNASRAFTLKHNALLSVGRVQTPTLAILVKRHLEIAAFKPEEYYTATADFGDYQGMWFKEGQENDTRIPNKETAEAIVQGVKGREGKVLLSESTPKQELPPQLYDLTTLQRDANRLLSFTAQKTLTVAQSLYETHKAITYPRTDSRHLPDDMAGPTKRAMQCLPDIYQPLIQGAMPEGKLSHSRRIFDNSKISDHHAILPTPKKTDISKLPPDEKKLFDLIVRRLLAAFYPAYTYDALKVITGVDENTFRTTGRTVKETGWKKVYEGIEKSARDEDTPLPALVPGDKRTVQKAASKKETTKPPPPLTDGSLLSAMEHAGKDIEDEEQREQMKDGGLGTPATRAAIIERLLAVGYVQRKGKTLLATDKGIELIRVAPPEIASPETTGRWELALNNIAAGSQEASPFLQGIRRLCSFLVNYAREDVKSASFAKEEGSKGKTRTKTASQPLPDIKCPVCKDGDVAENTRAFYCTRYRQGCRFTLWKDCLQKAGGPLLTAKLVPLLVKNGSLQGSTGNLSLQEGFLCFTPKGSSAPAVRIPITYSRGK